ncbi:hypothetical protein [Paenimyroides aestuarii]|uniref:Uncharacterized protein n=1 Tax=Paenimyroides aestuarii TaxID=2968490 RepID=A0ABY5NQK5_9FLAO|nr:hypothetical protein [Paenimyroides aestuarii]UUV20699.1 hypothetical protein NPX36_10165 [Paenimyroides aestuarii]
MNASYEKILNKDTIILILPKGLLQELAMFTMHTTRGVLHSKTEGHKYNRLFIPMIGGEFIKQDLAIPLNPTTVN